MRPLNNLHTWTLGVVWGGFTLNVIIATATRRPLANVHYIPLARQRRANIATVSVYSERTSLISHPISLSACRKPIFKSQSKCPSMRCQMHPAHPSPTRATRAGGLAGRNHYHQGAAKRKLKVLRLLLLLLSTRWRTGISRDWRPSAGPLMCLVCVCVCVCARLVPNGSIVLGAVMAYLCEESGRQEKKTNKQTRKAG